MFFHFVRKSASDFVRQGNRRRPGASRSIDHAAHLEAAAAWLEQSIDVCDGRASSKGYRLLKGWMTPYPETTGYIIPTLLALTRDTSDPRYAAKARVMGQWLAGIQQMNGGFAGREVGIQEQPDVFDTGMILLGFNALIHDGATDPFMRAGQAAADFLAASLDDQGCFVRNMSHGIVHTYNVRSAWALLAFAHLAENSRLAEAAVRCGHWTIAQQNEHGFYLGNNFKPGGNANTHGTAYVMRGLLQIHGLTSDARFLDSVVRAADKVCALYEEHGYLAAELGPKWQYLSSHICLTGYAQLGIILYRLFTITGRERYREIANALVDDLATYQDISDPRAPWHGAIAGSFPIYGRYAPFQYPNWATKFFADALLARKLVAAGGKSWPAIDKFAG